MRDDLQARIAALLPPIRAHLLAGVLAFTQVASRIPGVTRIALIGSLATDKPDSKDADVLVTVADDADLTLLAAHTRKLPGTTARAASASARYSLRTRAARTWVASARGKTAALAFASAATHATAAGAPTCTMIWTRSNCPRR
jgi:predicted nucleotidyltransferase